jgi:glyoxylate utilization-related uncharacterized protein
VNLEQKALQFAPKAALCFGFTPVLGECGVMVKGDAVFPLDSSWRAVILWGPRGDASV